MVKNKIQYTTLGVHSVAFHYGGAPLTPPLSLVIPSGSLVAVMGSNGSGKTTFLKTLAGLHRPHQGNWGWHTETISEVTPIGVTERAYLAQRSEVSRTFPLTVQQVVAMGLWKECGIFKPFTVLQQERILHALDQVQLQPYKDRPIAYLSGGQFQRMLFARLILQDASLLLLDEPFVGLDEATITLLLQRMIQWQEEGKILLVAQHNRQRVLRSCSHVLLLSSRAYWWGQPQTVLTPETWQEACGLSF